MKRLLITILSIIMLFSTTMCATGCELIEKYLLTKQCEHTGGTATCIEKAVCEKCGESYGELLSHNYSTLNNDEISHWYECFCGAKTSVENHRGNIATEGEKLVCEKCGKTYCDIIYTITFNDGNGGSYTPISIKYGEVISGLPTVTVSADKEFIGWKTAEGETISEGMSFTYVNDLELTAIFVAKKFTIVLKNTTKASFTEWADGTSGDKIVNVEVGGKLVIPKMKYDDMSSDERFNDYYIFTGWFYKDKNGNEKQLDLDKELTLESLGIEEYQIEVYAKVRRQWFGA